MRSHHSTIWRKIIASFLLFTFLTSNGIAPVRYAYGQEISPLPQPGTRIGLSPAFVPPLLKGIKVYPDDPFRLDFILDQGDRHPEARSAEGSQNTLGSLPLRGHRPTVGMTTRLIKYFLASITVPEKDLWVNLSPYEKDRIVPDAFGVTEMGRDLLAQDYLLKQITASVIYPEGETGKKFWAEVYRQAYEKFGTTDIPVDTFNKVWITPDKAVVYENKDSAYVVESHLKVMLETDYLAASHPEDAPLKGVDEGSQNPLGSLALRARDDIAKQVLRQIIIPLLEKEVNEGANFAQLRQVYHSLILATWFKDKVKESLLGKAYADRNKVAGVEYEQSLMPTRGHLADRHPEAAAEALAPLGGSQNFGIPPPFGGRNDGQVVTPTLTDVQWLYTQYLEAFKKGAFNYIKEEYDPVTQETMPRKHFSGGFFGGNIRSVIQPTHDRAQLPEGVSDRVMIVRANLDAAEGEQPSSSNRQARLKMLAALKGDEALVFAKEFGLDLRTSVYGMLHPLFAGHLTAIYRQVSDNDSSKPKVAVYGAAGADISTVVLATGAREIYMVDHSDTFTLSLWLDKKWNSLETGGDSLNGSWTAGYTASKYGDGYGGSMSYGSFNKEPALVAELKALGVVKEDIKTVTETFQNQEWVSSFNPEGKKIFLREVRFLWSPTGDEKDKQEYTVHFIKADIADPKTWPKEFEALKGKVDFYYQRAGFHSAGDYEKYLPGIFELIKPQGYLITDDHYLKAQGDTFLVQTADLPGILKKAGASFDQMPLEGDVASWREAILEFKSGQSHDREWTGDQGYGWDLNVYQKKDPAMFPVEVKGFEAAPVELKTGPAVAARSGMIDEFGSRDATIDFLMPGLEKWRVTRSELGKEIDHMNKREDAVAGDLAKAFNSRADWRQLALIKKDLVNWITGHREMKRIIIHQAGMGGQPGEIFETLIALYQALNETGERAVDWDVYFLGMDIEQRIVLINKMIFWAFIDAVRNSAPGSSVKDGLLAKFTALSGDGFLPSRFDVPLIDALADLLRPVLTEGASARKGLHLDFQQADLLSRSSVISARTAFERKNGQPDLRAHFLLERHISYLSAHASDYFSDPKDPFWEPYIQERAIFRPLIGYWIMRDLLTLLAGPDVHYYQEANGWAYSKDNPASATVFLAKGARLLTARDLSPELLPSDYPDDGLLNTGTGMQVVPHPEEMEKMSFAEFLEQAEASVPAEKRVKDREAAAEAEKAAERIARAKAGKDPAMTSDSSQASGTLFMDPRSKEARALTEEEGRVLNAALDRLAFKDLEESGTEFLADEKARKILGWVADEFSKKQSALEIRVIDDEALKKALGPEYQYLAEGWITHANLFLPRSFYEMLVDYNDRYQNHSWLAFWRSNVFASLLGNDKDRLRLEKDRNSYIDAFYRDRLERLAKKRQEELERESWRQHYADRMSTEEGEQDRQNAAVGSGFNEYIEAFELKHLFASALASKEAISVLEQRLSFPFRKKEDVLGEYATQRELAGDPGSLEPLLSKFRALEWLIDDVTDQKPFERESQQIYDALTAKFREVLFPGTGKLPVLLKEIEALLGRYKDPGIVALRENITKILGRHDVSFSPDSQIFKNHEFRYDPFGGSLYSNAPKLDDFSRDLLNSIVKSTGGVAASAALAVLRTAKGYKEVTFTKGGALFKMTNARHPVLKIKGEFQPVAFEMPAEGQAILISGLNTGGKSVTLKTAGLIALMVQCGIPVPADVLMDEGMFAGFVKPDIHSRDVSIGEASRFAAELGTSGELMRTLPPRTFAIIDDDMFGGASEPAVEASGFAATVESLAERKVSVIAVTHHIDALEALRNRHPDYLFKRIKTKPGADGSDETTYSLEDGIAGSSQGLHETLRQNWPGAARAVMYYNMLRKKRSEGEISFQGLKGPSKPQKPAKYRGFFYSNAERGNLETSDFGNMVYAVALATLGDNGAFEAKEFAEQMIRKPETSDAGSWRESIQALKASPDLLRGLELKLRANMQEWELEDVSSFGRSYDDVGYGGKRAIKKKDPVIKAFLDLIEFSEKSGVPVLQENARLVRGFVGNKEASSGFMYSLAAHGLPHAIAVSFDDSRAKNVIGPIRALYALSALAHFSWPFAESGAGRGEISIEGGWHSTLTRDPKRTPADVQINPNGNEGSLSIYTGFNTGGKSTLAKMIAQIVTLARMGWPVPAKSAVIGDFTDIQVVSGTLTEEKQRDHSRKHKSAIGGALAAALHESGMVIQSATSKTLVILDEPFSGATEPSVAAALTAALAEELTRRGATVILITHLLESVPLLVERVPYAKTFKARTEVKDGVTVPLYSFEPGIALSSHGFEVARKMKWPGLEKALAFFDVLTEQAQGKKDAAADPAQKGGIDLTRDRMDFQVQSPGEGVQFKFDPRKIEQLQNSTGLIPVIIDIRPMTTTVPMFLGLADTADKMASVR